MKSPFPVLARPGFQFTARRAPFALLATLLLVGSACSARDRDNAAESTPHSAKSPRAKQSVATAATESPDAGDAAPPLTARGPDRPRVLFVSCDGLRPDAILPDLAPTLFGLIAGGSYHPAGQAEFPPITLPNHSSMITGCSVLHHGVLVNSDPGGRISKPTMVDVVRAAGGRAGFFATKSKFRFLCADGEADARAINSNIETLTDAVIEALTRDDLDYVFLHYGQPDGAGHRHGWLTDEYFDQVTRVDTALGRVVAALDESGLREHTLIIITADHGGHGKIHGLPIPEDLNVPFILNGPGIAAGRRLDGGAFAMARAPRPMDAAANALAALGLTMEGIDGVPTLEASYNYVPPDMATPLVFGACGPLPPMMLLAVPFMRHRVRRRAKKPVPVS